MIEPPDLDNAVVAGWVAEGWGQPVTAIRFLPIGYDALASAYEVTAGGRRRFLKVRAKGGHPTAALVPRHLADSGVPDVLAPLPSLSGEPWHRPTEEYQLLLYPFVDGHDTWASGLTDPQWERFGSFLRALHDTPPPPELLPHLPVETFTRDDVRQVVSTSASLARETPDGAVEREFAGFWREHTVVIGELAARMEAIGRLLAAEDRPQVVCHTDLHGGNVLVDAEGGLFVVDWDEPGRGPRERDLLFVVGAHFGEQEVTPAREARFFQGYGTLDVDHLALSFYRHERVVTDLAAFARHVLHSGAGEESKRNDLGWFVRQFGPGSPVERALASPTTRDEAT